MSTFSEAALEQVRAIEAPGVTHITYRVVNGHQGRPA
jgi:hypothetical protein